MHDFVLCPHHACKTAMYENSNPRALAPLDVCLCCRYVEATGLSPADVPLAVAVHEGMGISLLLTVSATAPPSPISHTSPVQTAVSCHVTPHRSATPSPMAATGPVACSVLTLVALCLGACSASHRITTPACMCATLRVCSVRQLSQHA